MMGEQRKIMNQMEEYFTLTTYLLKSIILENLGLIRGIY